MSFYGTQLIKTFSKTLYILRALYEIARLSDNDPILGKKEIETKMLGSCSGSRSSDWKLFQSYHLRICWPFSFFFIVSHLYIYCLSTVEIWEGHWNTVSGCGLVMKALVNNIICCSHILTRFCCFHVILLMSLWQLSILIEMIPEIDVILKSLSDLRDSIVSLDYENICFVETMLRDLGIIMWGEKKYTFRWILQNPDSVINWLFDLRQVV